MSVVVTQRGGVAELRLDRPEQGNAIDLNLARTLAVAVADVAADPAVRCVTLTGSGRMFCVGGDIAGFAAAGAATGPFLRELADTLHGAVLGLATMTKPLITAINGPAAGAGLSLALLGDIVIAAEAASFTAAYTAIGLTPDGGMSWLLQRHIGLRRAQEIILTNRRIATAEAVTIGLVTRVVADDALAEEVTITAATLAAGPTRALGAARALLATGATATLADQLGTEAAAIAAAGAGPEGREGVAAFLARRPPSFA